MSEELEKLRADNAWLRAENKGLKEANELCGKNYNEVVAKLRQRGNAERLRAALEQIRTLDHGNDWDKEAPSVIAHMVTIATVALSEE